MKNLHTPKIIIILGVIIVTLLIYLLVLNSKLSTSEEIIKQDINRELKSVIVYLVETNNYIDSLSEGTDESNRAFYYKNQTLEVATKYDDLVSTLGKVTNIRISKERFSDFLVSFHGDFEKVHKKLKKGELSTEDLESLNKKKEVLNSLVRETKKYYNIKDLPDDNEFNYDTVEKILIQFNDTLKDQKFLNN